MIRILLLDTYRDTIDRLLHHWAHSLDGRVRSVAYESLSAGDILVGSTFIFGDLERFTEEQCARAAALAGVIEKAGGRVLNQPSRVLRRYDLLRALRAAGENPFNVFRPHELDETVKFPVFLRREREHTGAITGLVSGMDELRRALDLHRGESDLMVVEYVHTPAKSDGLFRKHSAMRIGERLIPRHLRFNTGWMTKEGDTVNDQTTAEEGRFLRDYPHAEQVWKIFNIAGIDYGRIDYAVLNGKVVTWEINTNPTLWPPGEKTDIRRVLGHIESARQLREAFLALLPRQNVAVQLSTSPGIVAAADISKTRRWTMRLSNIWKRVARLRGGTRLLEAIVRSINLAVDLNPPGPKRKSNNPSIASKAAG